MNGARLAAASEARSGLSRDLGTAAAPVIVPGAGAGTIKEPDGGTGTTTRVEGGDESNVAALLPAARAARDRLSSRGDVLTRDTLAAELRRSGHPVRNAKVSQLQLLTALKGEPVSGARDGISRYVSA